MNLFVLIFLANAQSSSADEITVAVASNFGPTAREIVRLFEEENDHKVKLVTGASGSLYAQIRNGAPFDIFLSADSFRPEALEKDGFSQPGSRFTYATGRLVLWGFGKSAEEVRQNLSKGDFYNLAIANPKMTAMVMPSVITKYPPIAEPIIKNAIPARYTEDGLSNPSGSTPVPPLILVLVVLISMPLLKSQKSFSKSTLACSAITPAKVNAASRSSMDEFCHQFSARATETAMTDASRNLTLITLSHTDNIK